MATSSSPQKIRHTYTALLFLFLFLISILFFSKRALEPTLAVYRDLSFQVPSLSSFLSVPRTERYISSLGSPVPVAVNKVLPYPESLRTFSQQPISPIPVNESNSRSGSSAGADTHLPVTENDVSFYSENEFMGSVSNAGFRAADASAEENSSMVNVNWAVKCDLSGGTWVKDEHYPIYEPGSCPYVDEAFSCQINGRRDSEYLKWRWKPDDCDLPRFNATDFLVRLSGKRLMLVGDSMNRNQFESMLCLLREGLSNKSRMHETHGYKITKGRGYYVFKFLDYNCTVEFVRSHFLVKEGIRINAHGQSNPTLSIDQIDKSAGRWKRADILVFNTGHWWTHGKTARGKNYYKEGDYIYPKFDAVEAYRRAMRTWGRWIDENINSTKKLVFYRGYSSAHFRGGDWDSGGTCNGETEPILRGSFLNSYPLKMKIMEEVLHEMRVPVILLNVTRLTNFRKDGHPSIYGKNLGEGRTVSSRKQDCSHWCLPAFQMLGMS